MEPDLGALEMAKRPSIPPEIKDEVERSVEASNGRVLK